MKAHKGSPGRPKKRLTLAHIAEAAGVSIPTVSRALNQSEDVAPETRERIEQAMIGMGYITAQDIREIRRKKRKSTVTFVTPHFNEYALEIIKGVRDVLTEENINLALCITYESIELERKYVNDAVDGITDGIIFIGLTHFLEELRNHTIPFAIADQDTDVDIDTPSVSVTNWAGARQATQYLINLGHRRIAMIKGLEDSVVSQLRLEGYRAALAAAGIPFDAELVRPGVYIAATGYQETLALLDLPSPPTAIFAGSDMQAIGCYQALYEREVHIPRQMSVIGFDDIAFSASAPPPLTTIRQPLKEMGRVATNMVLRQIEGKQLDSVRVELPTTLIERKSCAPPLVK